MILAELFDKSTPNVKVTYDTSKRYTSEAMINGRLIQFDADFLKIEMYVDGKREMRPAWYVSFHELGKNGQYTADKTGSGGELQVFSFVVGQLREIVKKHDPDIITFSGSKDRDNNRKKLYHRIASKLTDYKVAIDSGDYVATFVLTKKAS